MIKNLFENASRMIFEKGSGGKKKTFRRSSREKGHSKLFPPADLVQECVLINQVGNKARKMPLVAGNFHAHRRGGEAGGRAAGSPFRPLNLAQILRDEVRAHATEARVSGIKITRG